MPALAARRLRDGDASLTRHVDNAKRRTSFIAHLSHASRQPHGTASNVTGLPHLQVVISACSTLTTAVAMTPPPAQHMHQPQEPSCNSYDSSTDLPPTRAGTRGGHNRRRWAALRVRTPSIGAWPVGQVLDQGERRRVFLCLAKGRGVLSGFLDENSAHPSRRENTDFSRAPRLSCGKSTQRDADETADPLDQ